MTQQFLSPLLSSRHIRYTSRLWFFSPLTLIIHSNAGMPVEATAAMHSVTFGNALRTVTSNPHQFVSALYPVKLDSQICLNEARLIYSSPSMHLLRELSG